MIRDDFNPACERRRTDPAAAWPAKLRVKAVSGAPGIGRRDSASELTYQPGDADVGPAAITFEVVEDVDASVTDARSATLTIRIKVLPRAETKTSNGNGPNSPELNQPP